MKVLLPTLVVSAFLVPTSFASAGGIEYPLAEFRTTDIVRNKLFLWASFSPSLGNGSSVERTPRDEFLWDGDSSSLEGNIQVRGSRLVDRPRTIYDVELSAAYAPRFIDSHDSYTYEHAENESPRRNSRDTNSDGYYSSVSGSARHRDYISGHWFREAGVSGRAAWSYTSIRQTRAGDPPDPVSHSGSETDSRDAQFAIPLRLGVGRIHEVSYARTALYILDDLEDRGRLLRRPDRETIDDLANRLREVENDRVFDSRERRIHELRQVATFLQDRGLVGHIDAQTYASIKDSWRYVSHPARGSGLEASIGATYTRADLGRNSKSTNEGVPITLLDDEESVRSLAFDTRIVRQSPLSKILQLDQELEVLIRDADSKSDTARLISGDRKLWHEERDGTSFEAAVAINATYYPTSRDSWELSLAGRHVATVSDEESRGPDFDRRASDVHRDSSRFEASTTWTRSLSLQTTLVVGYTFLHDSSRSSDEVIEDRPPTRTRISGDGHSIDLAYTYEIF